MKSSILQRFTPDKLAAILVALFFGLTVNAFAQVKTVTGKVLDEFGEPAMGINVVEVANPTNGSTTDLNGAFSVKVPENAVLRATCVGYVTQEISVAGKTNVVFNLREDQEQLDEVVVVGYGVMKKRDLTGSVSSIKPGDLQKVATSNAMSAMQAKVPGLDIQQSNGEAGSSISMTLRGNRSISASNDPLILVDGVEYGSTLDIPASDIESMEILKDASSTAIYGTKGANGVIIITTKRGKAGKTNINFNGYLSFNSPTKTAKPMYGKKEVQRLIDKANYADDYKTGNWGESAKTAEDVLTESLSDGTSMLSIYEDGTYTDWIDLLLKNSITQNYELSVTGGNDKTTFNVSLAAMYDNGIMKGDELDRYNGRTNIDHTINKYVKIGTSLNFTYKSNDKRNSGVYNQALKMTTITHAYLNDGTINATPNPLYAAHCSPLLDDVDGAYQKNIETTRFFGNAYVQISPLKNLIYKSLFAVDRKNERTGLYQDFQSQGRYQSPSNTYISNAQEAKTGYTWQNTLNYNTDFNKSKHDLSVLLGHEMSQTVDETLSVAGTAGKEHYYTSSFYDVTKITSDMNNSSSYTKQSLLSFFGRVNYKFNEKYLLTVTGRTDGSSVLAEGNKWGFFPSAALAWRINDEDFMENTKDWLSSLKLRISAGIAGNAAVNPYQTVATLTSTTPNSVDKIPASMAEDLSWETTQSLDFGLDFGFLDGRINGSVDYYFNKTKDLLYYKSAPATTVYTSVLANVGESSGQGVEVSLNTLAIKQKNFSWDINWSYTHATDKLEKLADGLDRNINGYEALIVGEPVSIYYDYEADGCWNVGEFAQYKNEMAEKGITVKSPVSNYGDPGTLKIVDRNGDGVIDENDKRVYERSPKHIFGMNNTFTYKNWSLGVQVYARLGGYMNYGMNSQLNYESANWGDIDYWTPTNTGAKFPSPGLSSAQQTTYTTYKTALYWEKADYIKIKDINLNYNLPKNVLSKTGIANARVYASLKNFLSWSRVDNYDAERGGSISFPLQKQVVVGLNLQF